MKEKKAATTVTAQAVKKVGQQLQQSDAMGSPPKIAGVKFQSNGLAIDEGKRFTDDETRLLFRYTSSRRAQSAFLEADFAVANGDKLGKDLAKELGISHGGLRNKKMVAMAFPLSRRQYKTLSFEHYSIVRAVPEQAKQDELLEWAEQEHATTRELRDHINEGKPAKTNNNTPSGAKALVHWLNKIAKPDWAKWTPEQREESLQVLRPIRDAIDELVGDDPKTTATTSSSPAPLSMEEARKITGHLSRTDKMPCRTWGLNADTCKRGAELAKVPGSVCASCYATRGNFLQKNHRALRQQHLEGLAHPRWVQAMVVQIQGDAYFRWFDSGDLQDLEHLRKIVEVARGTPATRHWLSTREFKIVDDYFRQFDAFPPNLNIRISADLIDAPMPAPLVELALRVGATVSTVTTGDDFTCLAPNNDGECGDCRMCWDRSVPCVKYPLLGAGRRKPVTHDEDPTGDAIARLRKLKGKPTPDAEPAEPPQSIAPSPVAVLGPNAKTGKPIAAAKKAETVKS